MTILALDFDGTMTDAEAEGAPFRRGYLDDVAALVGRPTGDSEIMAIAAAVEDELKSDPGAHPFMWDDHIVAPASVDPYLRMVPIANRIFDRFDAFTNGDDRARLLRKVLYKYNYEKTVAVFRPGAREAIARLKGSTTYVVTNSGGAHVGKKIHTLDAGTGDAAWLADHVMGDAGKFVVDDSWDEVAPELHLPGLARPILTRRRNYYDVLARLCGGAFEKLIVVGDIFELDLAMPLVLGARVGLVANGRTPAYEVEYVVGHPRAHLLAELADIPELLAKYRTE